MNEPTVVSMADRVETALRKHSLWLNNHLSGERLNARTQDLDFSNLDLHGANLSYADLSGTGFANTNLTHAMIHHADLTGANLDDANLTRASLCGSNLSNATFCKANLFGAVLSGCNVTNVYFYSANLINARLEQCVCTDAHFVRAIITDSSFWSSTCVNTDFERAFLVHTNFGEANLLNANFQDAILKDAHLENAHNIPPQLAAELTIVPDGDLIVWKKLDRIRLAKLLIPAAARRSNGTERKCRAEYARVLSIEDSEGNLVNEGYSNHNPSFRYQVGEMVYPDSFDENRWDTCSHGIHFFLTREEAINY